jgi:hypothetical protein
MTLAAWCGGVLAADDGLVVELAPYAWLAGVDGSVTVGGLSADFDESFSDLVNDVDMGAMGFGVLRYRSLVAFGQFDYIDLEADAEVKADIGPNARPVGAKIDGEVELTIATVGAGYTFDLFDRHAVDVMLGVRSLQLDVSLDSGANKRSEDTDITDYIVMLSPLFNFGEKWQFRTILSYGFAGDSESTYELQPQLHYRMSRPLTLSVGYRKLHYEEESGQKGTLQRREFDGDIDGLMIGFSWTFKNDK